MNASMPDKNSIQLEPPDLEQCQAEMVIHHPFRLGGLMKSYARCKNKPVWVATEVTPVAGVRGSMSLCEECAEVATKQLPKDFATFKVIGTF